MVYCKPLKESKNHGRLGLKGKFGKRFNCRKEDWSRLIIVFSPFNAGTMQASICDFIYTAIDEPEKSIPTQKVENIFADKNAGDRIRLLGQKLDSSM